MSSWIFRRCSRSALLVVGGVFTSSCLSVCGGIEPHAPTASLEGEPAIALSECRSFVMHYYLGGPGGMRYLSDVSARCADPSVCVAKVAPSTGGDAGSFAAASVVYLAGLREGTTSVIVDFVDPKTQRRAHDEVPVTFVAPRREHPLEVGAETPRAELTVMRDRTGEPYQCLPLAPETLAALAAQVDHANPAQVDHANPAQVDRSDAAALDVRPGEDVAVFGCAQRREIAPGRHHYCTPESPSEQDVWVCITRSEAKFYAPVRGLVLYRRDASGHFVVDEVRGEPDRTRCP